MSLCHMKFIWITYNEYILNITQINIYIYISIRYIINNILL